ncbi:MAG TPA: (d)CMP kinase [Gemmatimonadaceae bacterium]|jgi:cytidylate kinase|nr:(d)CMP kinase [Gemmatimonadaceae bacterium]
MNGPLPFVIAIDGPAASGKSSTAQWVARRLGYRHVDSGALYRAATAARLVGPGDPATWTDDDVLLAARGVAFTPLGESFAVIIDGQPADDRLRDAQVTQHVSRVAQMQRVRQWVNELVRRTASGHDVVVDGRDMGTVVFPNADLKIFLVADPWERARRRLVQRLGRGPSDEEIAAETHRIAQRDALDATQSVRAADAVLIDTTYLTQEDQVDRIVALAHAAVQRRARPTPPTSLGSVS